MEFFARTTRHKERGHKWLVSRLQLSDMTAYGPIMLDLRIRWGRPVLLSDPVGLTGYCFRYSVVFDGLPQLGLTLAILDYFDARDRRIAISRQGESVLICGAKWRGTATWLATNRCTPGDLDALQGHMERRLINMQAKML